MARTLPFRLLGFLLLLTNCWSDAYGQTPEIKMVIGSSTFTRARLADGTVVVDPVATGTIIDDSHPLERVTVGARRKFRISISRI
jgi:hypothetical protein